MIPEVQPQLRKYLWRDPDWYPRKDVSHPPREGVYFVRWGNFVKVGTAADVELRRRAIEGSIPTGEVEGLGFIHFRSGGMLRTMSRWYHEGRIHDALRSEHERGEWFRDSPALRRFIAKYAKPWPA
jgi:hypothetical protein